MTGKLRAVPRIVWEKRGRCRYVGGAASKLGESFITLYGGAYSSKGPLNIAGGEAKLVYKRLELRLSPYTGIWWWPFW